MTARENHVSWDATLHIWVGQIWRIAVVNLAVFLAIKFAEKMTPVIHHIIGRASFDYSGSFTLFTWLFELYISYWALRQSLVDHYVKFTLTAENKETGRTMFGFDKRLDWHLLLPIWWAQLWRSSILTFAIVFGIIASSIAQHRDPSSYFYLAGNEKLLGMNVIATGVISIWATKESLADRYRRLRLVTRVKSFYSEH